MNKDNNKEIPQIRARFASEPVKYSDCNIPYSHEVKDTAAIVFRGDDKDLLISFAYEIEKKDKKKDLFYQQKYLNQMNIENIPQLLGIFQ